MIPAGLAGDVGIAAAGGVTGGAAGMLASGKEVKRRR